MFFKYTYSQIFIFTSKEYHLNILAKTTQQQLSVDVTLAA